MTPVLLAGFLVLLVGYGLVVAHAYRTSQQWGLLCLLCPPAQLLYVAMNWARSWEPMLMQVLGVALLSGFFLQAGGFSGEVVSQALSALPGELGIHVKPKSGSEVLQQGQQVAEVNADGSPAAPGGGAQPATSQPETITRQEVHTVTANNGPVSAVVAAPEKEKNDKPIYKCTDQQGNERWSYEPCGGPKPIKP